MEVESFLDGELWFYFSSEGLAWNYSLIGHWDSIWLNRGGLSICREDIIFKKSLEELVWI